MKKPDFVNNEIYHIYNRGVEKRDIFLGQRDKFRFVYCLFEFNNDAPAQSYYRGSTDKARFRQIEKLTRLNLVSSQKRRKPLVEILAFCLMPNHYHLLLLQKEERGIIKFMQKLGTGYTVYFNQKYKRTGALFQGRFKAVLVDKDSYFLYIPYYIHLNPLDLIEPSWKEAKIDDLDRVIKFLESYRWSSFLDYVGQKNFSSVTQREFLLSFYKDQSDYKKEVIKWLKEVQLSQQTRLNLVCWEGNR